MTDEAIRSCPEKPRKQPRIVSRRRTWLGAGILAAALSTGAVAAINAAPAYAERHHGRHEGGMGGGPMMGPKLERMLDHVNATPEQRTKVRAIWDAARPQLQAVHEEQRRARQQIAAALTSPTVDAQAVDRARQDMVKAMSRGSEIMSRALVDVANVLTPEQRQKVAEHMAKRF